MIVAQNYLQLSASLQHRVNMIKSSVPDCDINNEINQCLVAQEFAKIYTKPHRKMLSPTERQDICQKVFGSDNGEIDMLFASVMASTINTGDYRKILGFRTSGAYPGIAIPPRVVDDYMQKYNLPQQTGTANAIQGEIFGQSEVIKQPQSPTSEIKKGSYRDQYPFYPRGRGGFDPYR